MATAPEPDETPSPEHFTTYSALLWRCVESQNQISSDRLVEDPDDQPILEELIEEVKPPIPEEARHLPKLVATPFRYWHQSSSRFRRANEKPGILYTSETETTSVIEMAYHRLKFLSRSPDARESKNVVEHSTYTVRTEMVRTLDLMAQPYVRRRPDWTDPDDYTGCQDFAALARVIETQALRYESVRDPSALPNVAVFDPATVDGDSLIIERSWHFRFERGRLTTYAAVPSPQQLTFTFKQFGLDPPVWGTSD